MDIEKNEVNLADLFRWKGEVEINDHTGKPVATVYMRVVGDQDLNKARVFALRKSSELRKTLRTEGSDEHDAYIEPLKNSERDRLEIGVKLLLSQDLMDDARRNAIVKYPVEPASDASLEEQEKYQQTVDEFPEKYEGLLQEELDKLLKKEEKKIKKLDDDTLLKEYIELTINYVCQQEMTRRFIDMCIFYGTYKNADYKKKYFGSFDEYDNLAGEVKEQLIAGYNRLESGIPTIKKSQEATQ